MRIVAAPHALDDRRKFSDISLVSTRCLTASTCAGCIEKLRRPIPRSSRVMRMSPAISPHIPIGARPCASVATHHAR